MRFQVGDTVKISKTSWKETFKDFTEKEKYPENTEGIITRINPLSSHPIIINYVEDRESVFREDELRLVKRSP